MKSIFRRPARSSRQVSLDSTWESPCPIDTGTSHPFRTPGRLTLFQGPIEQACNTREEVVREIRITVVHEVGHFLGLREEDLDRLGYG